MNLTLSLVLLAAAPVAAQTPLAAADLDEVPEAAEALPALSQEDESIYVVQQRTYSKSGKFELTPLFLASVNNKFAGHSGFGLSAAYHVRENFAIELASTIPYALWANYSDLVFEVYDYETLTPENVDLKRMSYFGSVNAQFSALYGKMEFYGELIGYDFFVSAGFGAATTLETCAPNVDGCGDDVGIGRGLQAPDDFEDRVKLTGNLGAGMRFFFRDWAGLRIELRDVVYADRDAEPTEVTTDVRNNIFFILGFTFLL